MRKWRQLAVLLAVLGASLVLAAARTGVARETRSSSGGSTSRRLAAVDAVDAVDAELSADGLAAGAGMSRLPFGTCSSDSRRTSWGMTLKNLTPRQTFLRAAGSSGSVPILRQCFDIDRANQCSGDGGEANPCCDPSRSPTRLALRVDLATCGLDSLRGLEWTLDGRPLRFSIVRPGFLVFGRLGAWQQAAATRELCVSIPQDAANLEKCQTLKQLCVGRSTCKYRLFGAVDAAGNTLSSLQGTGTATSSCCFEGYTLDESFYGAGDVPPVEPPRLQSTQSLGQGFSKLLAAAAQLREAVKKGDPAAAAAAMQISYSEAPRFSAEAVLLQAEVPTELNATAWNSAVKSQGTSTMAPSYAAVAAAEAAFIALNSVGDTPGNLNVNFSEKALHWCDSPSPAAWDGQSVLATLAAKGAVAASCFGDAVGYEYPAAEVGKLGGSCQEVLGKCERWKGAVEAADLTPVGVADFRRLQEHVQKYHAAVAQIVMFSDMEQQLQVRQARDGDVWLNPEGASSIAVSAGEGAAGVTKRFVHFVVVTGWNFSSPDPKDHFWIVKDSLSGLGVGQYWKLGTQSPVGLGAWIGGFVKTGTANSSSGGSGGGSSPAKSGDIPAANPTPTPVQHSSTATGTAIPTQPLGSGTVAVGPAADSSGSSSGSGSSGSGSGGGKAEAPNKELPPVVIPGQPPVPARKDINTVTDVPFGADLPNFMAAGPTPPEASTAPAGVNETAAPAGGNETAANGGDGGAAAAAGGPGIVGPAATEIPAAATAGPAASVPDTPADAAGTKPGAGTGPALGPVDACATYTTSQACETLSEAWEKRGGAALLVPLQASFVDNFFVLRGQDIACLRPGTQLKFCSADSGAAAFSMLKDLGR